MKTSVLNAQTEKSILKQYEDLVRSFLHDLTCDYPNFGVWLEKILSEIKTGRRQIVIMTENEKLGDVVGLTILKTDRYEKKICTIRVAKEYKRHGYGTELVRKSLEILGTNYPLVTVSEKHIDAFKPFFNQFGFYVASKVKSLYHEGECEYFFNFPYVHQNVLMSMKPKYTDAIFAGKKRVEFRKVCFKETVRRVYVYASTPVKQVIGYFTVEKIEKDSPQNLWQRYGREGAILKENFFRYFARTDYGYAIVIKDVHYFKYGLTIQEVFSRQFVIPQNYRYIDNVESLYILDNSHILSTKICLDNDR